jgi:hypothetical protein
MCVFDVVIFADDLTSHMLKTALIGCGKNGAKGLPATHQKPRGKLHTSISLNIAQIEVPYEILSTRLTGTWICLFSLQVSSICISSEHDLTSWFTLL